ncbi:ER membrane protein complex subunit 7 [Trichinella patagoniensis]|uniref:ER membrane protein complex subunit 7 n=1 Tax=Trichinella patagoniensis TaxID=990121 RepID=A0A0V1A992_9BILA|nr:ER membrane protein complex subunit 7 [Trichinella patagoniensis]
MTGPLADAVGVQPHVLPIPGYAGGGAPCAAPRNIDALTDIAKRLFQSLWLSGLNWDAQLPLEINACGVNGKKLEILGTVRVLRALMSIPRDQVHHSEMNVFGDASDAAFGAVAYLMTVSMGVVKEGDPWRWMPFVVNRVQKIINLTDPFQWLQFPTTDNPADKFSSGCDLEKLVEDHFWWNGPAWLRESEDQWPPTKVLLSLEEIRLTSPEQKLITVLVTTVERTGLQNIIDPGKHSKMERLGRITEYCVRFEKNARSSGDERKSEWPLSFLKECICSNLNAAGSGYSSANGLPLCYKIEGRVYPNWKLKESDGTFVVHCVPSGSYVVEVANADVIFEPYRVEINARGKIRARKLNYVQPAIVYAVPYPLKFAANSTVRYFRPREQWRIVDFLLNPMVLMMLMSLFIIVVFPKLNSVTDPEIQREMQQTMSMPSYDLPELSELMANWVVGKKKASRSKNLKLKR